MAQFQKTVLDYLEHYEPEKFLELKKRRMLRAHMDELVEQLYEETDRELRVLRAENPGISEEQLSLHAERAAIATVLPLTSGETQEQQEAQQ